MEEAPTEAAAPEAEALTEAAASEAEALMEAVAPMAEGTPCSAGADIFPAVLAAGHPSHLVTLAVGTRAADEPVAAHTPDPADFFLVRPAISRAILPSEAEVSARQRPHAISVAPELRNRRREVPVAPWAIGVRLETSLAGRCPHRHATRETQWAVGRVHSAI
jgi:hypothetical protein